VVRPNYYTHKIDLKSYYYYFLYSKMENNKLIKVGKPTVSPTTPSLVGKPTVSPTTPSLKGNTQETTLREGVVGETVGFPTFLTTLDEKEMKAYLIAKDHLGSSFQLEKSNGFLKWKKSVSS
jgi:hypothetical protein